MKSNWGKKKKQLDQGIFAAVPTYKGSWKSGAYQGQSLALSQLPWNYQWTNKYTFPSIFLRLGMPTFTKQLLPFSLTIQLILLKTFVSEKYRLAKY